MLQPRRHNGILAAVDPLPRPGAARLTLPLPRQSAARSQHPALITGGAGWSYAELAAAADDAARRLAGLGLGPGDRVATCLPNGADSAILLHAAARLATVLVPLNTRLTVDELAWQLADCAPAVVVWAAELGDQLPALAPEVRLLVSATGDRPSSGPLSQAPTMSDLRRPDVPLLDTVDPTDPATLIYTSGTTGRPKGALLTHGNQRWSALASALRLGVRPDDRWLLPLPLFHVGGLAVLVRAAIYGTTAEVHGRFDAEAVAGALASGRITLCSLVPTMLARVLDVWGDKPVPANFRGVLLGGGPIGPHLLRRAGELGLPVAPSYGLSEAASQVATAAPSRDWPGSQIAADPLPFTRLRVVDELGREVSTGSLGEIQVTGPTVMAGYWRQPEATDRALAGGWLHTGDAGWLDEAGRLHVADRRDDLIVTGGENVYPAEVEAVLAQHPAVVDVCVVGVPDVAWGQRVVAVVVSRGADLAEAELAAYAREHLAGFKVPRAFVWADALPRTAAGKLQRGEVRAGLTGGG